MSSPKKHLQCFILFITFSLILCGNCLADKIHGIALVPLLGQPCSLIFLDMYHREIKDITEGAFDFEAWLLRGIFVTQNSKTMNSRHFGMGARCLYGITHAQKFDNLQSMLLYNRNRQLILFNDYFGINNVTSKLLVHKHHHPVTILGTNNNGLLTQRVACQNENEPKTINFIKNNNNAWKYPFDVTSLTLEKHCNSGKHPLHGTALVGSVLAIEPFVYVDYSTHEVQGGVAMDILKTIAEYYNFKYHVSLADDVFAFFPNGTIGGSLGEVAYGKVDFSLEQSIQLSNIFGRFTTMTYHLLTVYIELKPKRLALYKNIIDCFHIYTWAMTGVALLCVWITLYIIMHTESKVIPGKKSKPLLRTLEMTYGNIFQEYHGVKGITKNLLPTTFQFLWILMTTFIVMAFHGNLKSSLVRKIYEERTKTLNEMIDKDMIVHVSSTLKSFLENAISQSDFNKRMLCQAKKKDSVYILQKDFFKQMYGLVLEQGGTSGTYEQSVEVLRNTYIMAGKDFPFVTIPEWWGMMPQGIVFHNSDPRPDYFDPIIRRLQDFGVVDFFFRKHMPPKGMKANNVEDEEPLVIEHLYLPLIFWVICLLVALGLFGFEKLLSKYDIY